MSSYGERIWYTSNDHSQLHEDLRARPAETLAAVERRPHLARSVKNCQTCTAILGTAVAVPTAEPQRRVRLLLGMADIAAMLQLPPGHEPLYLWTDNPEQCSMTVMCPPEETGDCALAAAPAVVVRPPA